MVEVLIRVASPGDIAALRDIFRRSSLSNEGDRDALLAHPEALELPALAVNEGRTRVAVAAGHIVGFATLLGSELEDLFVDPNWMRRGIGRILVFDAISEARRNGLTRLEVTANPHALHFYASVGFLGDGTVETEFGPGERMHLDC